MRMRSILKKEKRRKGKINESFLIPGAVLLQSNRFRKCSCQKTSLPQRRGEWEDNHGIGWNIFNLTFQIVSFVYTHTMPSFKLKSCCANMQHINSWKQWQDLACRCWDIISALQRSALSFVWSHSEQNNSTEICFLSLPPNQSLQKPISVNPL